MAELADVGLLGDFGRLPDDRGGCDLVRERHESQSLLMLSLIEREEAGTIYLSTHVTFACGTIWDVCMYLTSRGNPRR